MSTSMGQPPPSGRPAVPPPPRYAAAPPEQPARKRSSGRIWTTIVLIMVAVVALAILIVVVLTGNDNKPETTANQGDNKGASVPSVPAESHSAVGALKGRKQAQFELTTGADAVTVRAADLGQDMYRVSTPVDGALIPKVSDTGAKIKLELVNSGQVGAPTAEVQLNAKVVWQLTLAGGGMREIVDFSAGQLASLTLAGGAMRIEVTLPKPTGTLAVKLTAPSGQFTAHLAAGPPVRVKLAKTAGNATIDGKKRDAPPAGTVIAPSGWAKAKDRYDIDAAAEVPIVVVDRK